MADGGAVDNAAVRNHRMIDLSCVDFRAGQETRPAEDRSAHIKEIESRKFVGDVEVGLEKGADGADVFPITLENERVNAQVFNGLRDDVFAKIGQIVFQQT